jgi:hypothetical protein
MIIPLRHLTNESCLHVKGDTMGFLPLRNPPDLPFWLRLIKRGQAESASQRFVCELCRCQSSATRGKIGICDSRGVGPDGTALFAFAE